MNTNGLAKMYEHLSPRERLPFIVAASVRGDEIEKKRLSRSAPSCRYRLPDYHGLAEGIKQASLLHTIQLLDLAALYWQTSWLIAETDEDDEAGRDRREQMSSGAILLAYVFLVHVDGWQKFLSEMQIDPGSMLRDMIPNGTVKQMEEIARVHAVSEAEAIAWLRRNGDVTAKAITVDSVVSLLRDMIEDRVQLWA